MFPAAGEEMIGGKTRSGSPCLLERDVTVARPRKRATINLLNKSWAWTPFDEPRGYFETFVQHRVSLSECLEIHRRAPRTKSDDHSICLPKRIPVLQANKEFRSSQIIIRRTLKRWPTIDV